MKACKKCDVELLGMVLSSDDEKETISYRCPSCGDVFIEETEKIPVQSPVAEKSGTLDRPQGGDKHIKVHRDIWSMANKFVQENKIMYPSIKFFTQQAIIEKIRKENNDQ